MKDLGPIAIGGRYDNFFTDLGSPVKVPAVGCSVYVDRLLMAGDKYV
jgi:histidyl-tRNA synthetase